MSSGWFLKEGAGRAAEGRVWWPWVVPFRQPRLQGVSIPGPCLCEPLPALHALAP